MKVRRLLFLSLLLAVMAGCKKEETVAPEGKFAAYLKCPQTDIPWPSLANSPWPMFLHDPQHTSRSPLAGPQNGTFTRIGPVDEEIFSSPAITEDGLIIFGADGVFAFDASGTQVWHFDTGGTRDDIVYSTACIASDGTIYIGCINGKLYALYPDGSLKWYFDTENTIVFDSPAISKDGSSIYITTRNRDKDIESFFAIDTNGLFLWKYEISMLGHFSTSPAISPDGNMIYITGEGALHALDPNGQLKWKFEAHPDIGVPIIDNAGNIYLNSGSFIYSVDPNGSLTWSLDIRTIDTYSAPCIGYDGFLYTYKITSFGSWVCALDYAGQVRWEVELKGGLLVGASSPSSDVHENIFIGLCCGGINDPKLNFLALTKKGETLFDLKLNTPEQRMPDIDTSPVIGANGIVYTGSDAGRGYYVFKIE